MPKRAWRIECGGCADAHRLKFLFIVRAFYLGIIMFAFYFRSTSHGIFGNRNCGGFASSNSARI